MPQKGKIAELFSVAAIFILLEIAAISMLKSSSTLMGTWLSSFSHMIISKTWGPVEYINQYFTLRATNDDLAEENFKLSMELERLKSIISEKELQTVFSGKDSSMFKYVPASIVKLSRNSQHNYIILNKGEADGVLPNSGIITNMGVVGIIDCTNEHYSYGMSFQNTKISVSARIGRTGFVNPLYWDGLSTNKAIMNDIPVHFQIQPGDSLWTSGFSTVFPGDIPLGTILTVSEKNGSKTITVELFQDFSSLRYVTIVSNSDANEIKSLEDKANKED